MSVNQIRLLISVGGLFLLSVTVYRWQVFTHFAWTIFLFKSLVILSFFMLWYGIGRLLRAPLWLCLAVPVLIELCCWRYIRHVIAVNQNADVHRVGILENWITYRDVIQFNRQFSSFSPELGYTLRPGSNGLHASLEYENRFAINSLGVRDDEHSLRNPKIVFLGDSFTMGWGIDQDQTFAQLTEKQMSVPALNAGISSYGTYREMQLFNKIRRDSCQLLVVQYCDNDLEENMARNDSANVIQSLTPEKFEKVTVFNLVNEGYFPMRYTYFFVREKELIKRIFTSPVQVAREIAGAISSFATGRQLAYDKPQAIKPAGVTRQHTEHFFKVLAKIRASYQGNILVMHLDGRYTRPEIINAFEAEGRQRGDMGLYFLKTSDFLQATDYYPIDGHINAKGHQKIADQLCELIRAKKLVR